MKSKQVKKVLSITIASAVIASSTPTGPLLVSAEGQEENEAVATAETPAEQPKEEEKPAEQPKEEEKPAEQPKEEEKPAEQPKEEEKPAEQPKEEEKPAEQPKEEEKPAEQPKEEEKPAEQPKQEEKPKEETKPSNAQTQDGTSASRADAAKPTQAATTASTPGTASTSASKEITVTWPAEITWDGADHSVAAATSEEGVTLTYTVKKGESVIAQDIAEPKVKEPGTYTIIVRATAPDKTITVKNPAINYTVKKAKVTEFSWSNLTPQYNDGQAVAIPTATFASANGQGEIEAVVSYVDSADKNYQAGDKYEVQASLTSEQAKYYEIDSSAANIKATLEIQKKVIAIEWHGAEDCVYDGKEHFVEATSKDYSGNITVNYSSPIPPTNAETYTVTAKIADDNDSKNYVIDDATKSKTFTIEKCAVTVKPDDISKVYGVKQDPDFTYTVEVTNGEDKENQQAIVSGYLANIKDGMFTREKNENAGSYAITGDIGDYADSVELKNYAISFAPATFEIKQLPVKVTPKEGQSKVYGDSDLTYDYDVEILEETNIDAGDVKKELGTGVLKLAEDPKDAKDYAFELVNSDGDYGNFSVRLSEESPSFTIKQKKIDITWSEDNELIYNGKQQSQTCKAKDGETDLPVEYHYYTDQAATDEISEPVNAGTYFVKAVITNNNYVVSEATQQVKEFTIKQCDVAIAAEKFEKVYGAKNSFDYTAKVEGDDKLTNEVTALLQEQESQSEGEAKASILTSDGDENVGTHEIVLKDNIKLANYRIKYTSAMLTITQLPVKVIPAENQAKVYGEEDPEYLYSVNIPEETKGGSNKTAEDVQKELQNKSNPVLTREKIEGDKGVDTPASEDGYAYKLAQPDYGNFAVTLSNEKNTTFRVTQKSVDVEWSKLKVTYNGEEQKPVATAKNGEIDLSKELTYTYNYKGGAEMETAPKNAGTYTVVAGISNPNYAISEKTKTTEFTIDKCDVTIAAEKFEKVYGAKNSFDYTAKVEGDDKLTNEVTALLQEQESQSEGEAKASILTSDGDENVGTHEIVLKDNIKLANYRIKYTSAMLTITQLPVKVIPAENQAKVYGEKDPEYDYSVEIPEITKGGSNKTVADVKKELQKKSKPVLTREEGNDVIEGGYAYKPAQTNYGNFAVTCEASEDNKFIINKLPVTIIPGEKQHKTYGENDTKPYEYIIDYESVTNASPETTLEEGAIRDELKQDVLDRVEGELPGNYEYSIRSGENGEDLFKNYALTVGGKETFTIDPVQIGDIQSIDSRQGSFDVKTNIDDSNRKEDVVTRVKVEAEFPDSKEISFSEDIETYIKSANEGIGFSTSETTVKIQDAVYAKTRKDNKKALEWTGKLPAGTEVTVSVVDAKGNPVSKESKVFKVAKKTVTLNGWSGTKAGTTGNYTVANGGKSEPLTLTGDHGNEYVEILYSQTSGGAAEASYAKMNTTFTPVVNNSGSTHVMQHITAGIVDTLNLTCTSVDHTFYVDDQAFPIESSAIQFENRGKEIKIRLPETGTITNVSIAGAKVETSGSQGQDFTFKVDWSGKNLIPTGTAISVTYKDQAGHEGTGTGTATRSSVSTPITFRIRPELNANGYLNGQSNTLIVSGAACSCEPIRVTAAGQSQTVNATQVDTWSDSNGSWEVMFDMNSFPEKQDFTISAEYTDVNGASHSISAKYEAFVSPANIASPIYEAMTHISGMVEPGTAVALVINGDKKKYQEIEVDRFGRLSMDDVPMMFGGEDSFDIYVQDIAGNVSISHYEIPEAKDPSEVTSSVNPLGKYIFQGDKEKASSYAATPISGKDFTDKKDTLELPLIMGMSYEVGKLTVKKSSNGIVVSSAIDANGIDKEDYKIENEHLYVYKAKPSADDIEKKTGKEYAYGEEIPLGENDTIWIVDNKDMTILTESIEELELFNYKESKEYETYQEQ